MINFKSRSTEHYSDWNRDDTLAFAREHIAKIKERSSSAYPEKYVLGCMLIDFYESKSYAALSHKDAVIKECGYNFVTNVHSNVFFAICDIEFGLDKSKVSRYMNVVDEFGSENREDGLDEKYRAYKWSVLEEMLSLDELQRKQIKPGMTVREVREVKKMLVAMSQQNKPKPEKPKKNERFKLYTRADLIKYIEELESQLEGMKNITSKKGRSK